MQTPAKLRLIANSSIMYLLLKINALIKLTNAGDTSRRIHFMRSQIFAKLKAKKKQLAYQLLSKYAMEL